MKNIGDIRRMRLEQLVQETESKTMEEVAERGDTNAAYLSQIRNQTPDSKTGTPKQMGTTTAKKLEKGFGKPKGWMDVLDFDHNEVGLNDDTVQIVQYHDHGGAMGDGILLKDQPGQITRWSVTKEWIHKNVPANTGKENLRIVTGFGDSMKGMFNSGDPLIIDVGIRTFEGDAVYFFRVENEGFIKRLQRIPGEGIRVISKNKDYDTWTIKDDMDFEVLGRVLKVWNSDQF